MVTGRNNGYWQKQWLLAETMVIGRNDLSDLTPFHSRLDRSVSTHWLFRYWHFCKYLPSIGYFLKPGNTSLEKKQ